MRVFAFCSFFFLAYGVAAQITFDAKVSDRHLKKVERSKDARTKLEKYKKAYSKDSIKAAKGAWRGFRKQNKDSLKTVGKWKEAKANRRKILLGEYSLKRPKQYAVDHTKFEPPKDSMDWAMQELAKAGDFAKVQEVYEEYGAYDSAYLDEFELDSMQIDSLILSDRMGMKERLKRYLPPELAQESDLKIEQQMLNGKLDQYGKIQKVDRSGVKDFFANISPEEYSKSQLSLQKAKAKYIELPNLQQEEKGIKRNSLKGSPLKNRFFLNGNVTLQSTDPLILDTNLQLGYQWNKKFSTGIGIILREQLNDRDSSNVTGDAHGLSLFTSYDISNGFYVYAEYQLVKNSSLFSESPVVTAWQYAALLGVGRKFSISEKISFSVLLLYDFNYKNNDLSQRPLTPRIGYSIGF
ncbi:MAG: hypothetical protein HRT61_11090 [Ekhidna sp.]|nr:hypothetical protein [Ekhidna sp.]